MPSKKNLFLKKTSKIVINTITVFAFFSILGYTILNAYGYRLDTEKISFVRTGVLDLRDTKEKYNIYLGQKDAEETTPIMLTELDLKSTKLQLSKPDHYTWQKYITISPRIITKIPSVKLIPIPSEKNTETLATDTLDFAIQNNQIAILNNQNQIYFLNNPTTKISAPDTKITNIYFCEKTLCLTSTENIWQLNPDNTFKANNQKPETKIVFSPNGQKILTKNDQEIRIKNLNQNLSHLIARYSSGLTDAKWYSDSQLIISKNNELTIQDLDGQNMQKISDLDGKFIYQNQKIYYTQDGKLKALSVK